MVEDGAGRRPVGTVRALSLNTSYPLRQDFAAGGFAAGEMVAENRRSRLLSLATRVNPFDNNHERSRRPSGSLQPLANDPPSSHYNPNYSDQGHGSDDFQHQPMNYVSGIMNNNDDLLPPQRPFSTAAGDASGQSSRRSSFSSDKREFNDGRDRPASLSLNYVPAKFTKLHAPGDWAHRRAKQGGGRDAFARDAQRMGMMGTVDDDEGVVFQLGKGGLKKKSPKLRWNRFKWILFIANTVLIAYGLASLIMAILVWLNVFYQSDVIRVGNRTELILSTVAGALITLTSLIGYSGIVLNNRAFLAIWTVMLWACLALMVAPGYMTYKQRTFNLEGKINLQWSRFLGTEGRLRIQDALRCCGYYSPYVEATQSPLCFSRSNFPGCKNRYLKLERKVLETWYIIAFSLVPAHVLIIVSGLLCSNHITYRFGKGLTPKRYRLDLGSMAVIMDDQIAAQYGPGLAAEAMQKSSSNMDAASRHSLSLPGSSTNLATVATGSSANLTRPTSRFASTSSGTNSTGFNTQAGRGTALFDPSRDSFEADRPARSTYMETETDRGDATTRYDDSDYDYTNDYYGQPEAGQPNGQGQAYHAGGSGTAGAGGYNQGWAR